MKFIFALLFTLFIYNVNAQLNTATVFDTIALQHFKRQKTILFKVGHQIKLRWGVHKVKGKIVSISNGYMSIDPNKKKLEIVDSIDVNQLKWIKKYNDREGLRPLGAFIQVIGTIGTSFFILGTIVAATASEDLVIAGAGGLIGSVGIHLSGYYMQGARRYLGGKWRWIE
jgi:NADPH-dependent curcumin reductase CurA